VARPGPKVGGGVEEDDAASFFPQAWSDGGESCPEGTVPVRRTTRRDVLRASSARRFGMKTPRASNVRRDSASSGHEVSVRADHRIIPYVLSVLPPLMFPMRHIDWTEAASNHCTAVAMPNGTSNCRQLACSCLAPAMALNKADE
jgi:hypothetical protein